MEIRESIPEGTSRGTLKLKIMEIRELDSWGYSTGILQSTWSTDQSTDRSTDQSRTTRNPKSIVSINPIHPHSSPFIPIHPHSTPFIPNENHHQNHGDHHQNHQDHHHNHQEHHQNHQQNHQDHHQDHQISNWINKCMPRSPAARLPSMHLMDSIADLMILMMILMVLMMILMMILMILMILMFLFFQTANHRKPQ